MKNFIHDHQIVLNHIIVVSMENIYSSPAVNEVVTVSQSNLIEIPSNGNGNISSNTVSLNSNNLGSFVLVPLSMLNLPFSSNLKTAQHTSLESQIGLLQASSPSSETKLISSTNLRRRGPTRDTTQRNNIPQSKFSGKVSTVVKSNYENDECGRARREKMVERKRKRSKNTRNKFRQASYKKDGSGLKAKYGKWKSICRNDSTLCLVCGEKAGQHTYYGGKSCQSCRAFFRRSVHIITRLVLTILFS